MKQSLFLPITLLVSFTLNAQTWEAGLSLGGAVYSGDIGVNLSNALPQTRPAIGLFGDYHLNANWGLRTQLTFASLYADEKKYPNQSFSAQRAFSFQSPITELSFTPELTLLRKGNLYWYAFAGVAATYFNPTTNYNESANADIFFTPTQLTADKLSQKAHVTLAVPVGTGVKYILHPNWVLGVELGVRKTFTDQLDGVSQTASPNRKDYYLFGTISVSMLFPTKKSQSKSPLTQFQYQGLDCPRF